MLPAAKMAPEINRSMASLFAQEILSQEILGDFEKTFSTEVCPDNLENTIYTLLKENYSSSSSDQNDDLSGFDQRLAELFRLTMIYSFFTYGGRGNNLFLKMLLLSSFHTFMDLSINGYVNNYLFRRTI